MKNLNNEIYNNFNKSDIFNKILYTIDSIIIINKCEFINIKSTVLST
jgi:hypothetical protein